MNSRGSELGLLEAQEVSSYLGKLDGAGIGEHVHVVRDENERLATLFIVMCAKCSTKSGLINKEMNWTGVRFNAFMHQHFARSSRVTEFGT